MTIVSPLLLALVAGVSSSATAPPPEPAPWPSAFFAGFAEWITPFAGQPVSSGSWAYSYATGEWRAEHDAPQANNFCGCASNSSASCALIFSATGHMYVDFFGSPETCCRLCDAADGCSVLKPDWLSAAPERVFVGASIIGGRECYEWCIPGDYATADCFAFTADQTPCRYSESFNFSGTAIVHNLTFTSFTPGPQPKSAFAVRPECAKACPRTFPQSCG